MSGPPRSESAPSDVVIIGGGIIGLAVAREAARSGLSVRLLERGEPGCEASSAAAGMLGAQVDASSPHPLLDLLLASRALYPAFLEALRRESGRDIERPDHGTLVVARRPATLEVLADQERFQRSIGLSLERLDAEGARRLEPALADDVLGGLFFGDDGSVDVVQLVAALSVAASRAGAVLHAGLAGERLLVEGGRVTGVEAAGRRFAAGAVLIAAGAWSGAIGGAGVPPLPSHPVRGQMISFSSGAPRHILVDEECYLVPRRGRRLLAGSTLERVGFDRRTTDEGTGRLAAAALSLAPPLADAPVLDAWAGLRPATDDDLPALGAGASPGLFYAFGHLRHGILLAPVTALIMTRLLRGEPAGHELAPFDPRRFASRPV